MPGVLRLLLTVLIAVGAVVLMFPLIIKRLRQLHVGQNIRPDGPQSHLKKARTPTMGGIMIIAAVVLTVLIVGTVNQELLLAVLVTVALGVVGFIDDYTKVISRSFCISLTFSRRDLSSRFPLGVLSVGTNFHAYTNCGFPKLSVYL